MTSLNSLVLFLACLLLSNPVASIENNFQFPGFDRPTNLTLNGLAQVTPTRLLELTNRTAQKIGHAFYPSPLNFKSSIGKLSSFSTTFVFTIIPPLSYLSGHGIAFFISPAKDFPNATASQYLGLFNISNDGNSTNRIVAVELDTIRSTEFNDINDNHVGIDINSLKSKVSKSAAYYDDKNSGKLTNLTLISGEPMQVWIEYDGNTTIFEVTIAPFTVEKPKRPLISKVIDISDVVLDEMYVGFSSSTGSVLSEHYINGWSFALNGKAQPLDLGRLPLAPKEKGPKNKYKDLAIWIPVATGLFVFLLFFTIYKFVKRKAKFAEVMEDWELKYGPQRFSYKDLYNAADGFKEKKLLGSGGFGRVYHGVLPHSKMEVAIKKVSHESKQGIKEFIAEIVSMGQLRHRNLVQLLGYCRRKGELLLVYDFMPNGSLDRFLFNAEDKTSLNWDQRFQIIRGIASGLLYLHEDWEKVVIHRDVKASNVMLDSEMNGRLGDFGLARLYDRGADAHTTHVVGTMGYIAPELSRTGRATVAVDVFAFGAFLFEVACGKRPVELRSSGEDLVVVDWVLENWRRGNLLDTRDPRLGYDYSVEEMELVLKLGLLCSNPVPACRPTMRHVVQILEGTVALPELSEKYMDSCILNALKLEGFDDFVVSYPSVATYSDLSEVSTEGR